MSALVIGKYSFNSRLIVGTGKYKDYDETKKALEESGAEMITVALRRVDLTKPDDKNLLDYIGSKYTLLPNTAGCYTAKDAVLTCKLAREALGATLVKLEVLGDPRTLFPDNEQLLEAAQILVKDGFTVLPYCIDDPIVCKKL
ncbi:MAG TPA: thiazole synthase, partial [bacterium]|nr:thiazole synthase [bacterium]